MHQLIPSLTILLGKPLGKFLKGQIPHPVGHKESAKPRPLKQKIVPKPHVQGNDFQKSSKEIQNTRQKL